MLNTLPPPDYIVQWLIWVHRQYPFVGTLCWVMLIDVITGLVAGSRECGLSSQVSWFGMGKKVLMLLAVALGLILEPHSGMPLGQLIAVFYTVTEGISVIENLDRAGVPVPQQLREALEQYRTRMREAATKGTAKTNVVVNNAEKVDIHDLHPTDTSTGSVVIKTKDAPTAPSA